MRVHPAIIEGTEEILSAAKLVGLDKIDYDKKYTLFKTEAKNKSTTGIPDDGYIDRGNVYIIGNEKQSALYLMNHDSWFKTSQVLSCEPIELGYRVETNNSIYELRVVI